MNRRLLVAIATTPTVPRTRGDEPATADALTGNEDRSPHPLG